MIFYLIFWFSLMTILYHMCFYGLLLLIINKSKGKCAVPEHIPDKDLPSITAVCAAYNEEAVISQKLESFLALDYPADKIRMVIISDDSTDATNAIVSEFQDRNVSLVVQKHRAGKQAAQNLVLPTLTSDFVLSTDANSLFQPDSVRILAEHILFDARLGLVSGELRLLKPTGQDSGEGLYWRWESFLKLMDSAFHSLIGANGSLFLMKRELFTQVDAASVDDFERTLTVLEQGWRAAYVPQAIVTEDATEQVHQEMRRKIRIITQEWFAMFRHAKLLNPFQFPQVAFLLFSHKLIRWLLFVFALGMLLASAAIGKGIYLYLFIIQVVVYTFGAVGIVTKTQSRQGVLMNASAYITGMCYASCLAFIQFLAGRQIGVWNPTRTGESK